MYDISVYGSTDVVSTEVFVFKPVYVLSDQLSLLSFWGDEGAAFRGFLLTLYWIVMHPICGFQFRLPKSRAAYFSLQ
jgi:hypothetical protein